MQIDWFWLTVIVAIVGLTITATLSNYFRYKSKKYNWFENDEKVRKWDDDKVNE